MNDDIVLIEPEIVEPHQLYRTPFDGLNRMMNQMHSLMGSFDGHDNEHDGGDISVIRIETTIPDQGIFRFRSSINFGDSDDFFAPRPFASIFRGQQQQSGLQEFCACMLRRFQGLVSNQMNRILDMVQEARDRSENPADYLVYDEEEEEEEEQQQQKEVEMDLS